MTFSKLLKALSEYGRTVMGKSSNANAVEEIIAAQAKMTQKYAQSVLKKPHLSEGHLMTVSESKKKLRDYCMSQVGYHESWDGSNKYADGVWDVKLYGFNAQNVPWCDVFVDGAFINCFGYDAATQMTFQVPAGFAACALSAEAYKKNGAFYLEPEVGDQIFFIYGGGINHTGIVVEVNGEQITCVEGNYSDGVGLTHYSTRNRQLIAGYGRPDWSVVAEPDSIESDDADDGIDETIESEEFDIIHPKYRRTYMHLEYGDGIGMPIAQVRAWQSLLQCWGFVLDADGEFGTDTANATRQWQKKAAEIGADVEINGIVDEDDWKAAIEVQV